MRENGDVEAPSHPSARPTAIVIGAGFGGISVAGRLARAGYSVTCLEKAATPGGRCAELVRDGHRFDMGPSIVLVPSAYREAFEALGDSLSSHVELQRVDPTYTVRFHDGAALELTSDLQRMEEQLEEMEAGSFRQFLSLIHQGHDNLHDTLANIAHRNFYSLFEFFNPLNAWLLFKLNVLVKHFSYVSRLFTDPRLRAAFSFQDMYIGVSPYDAPATFSLLQYTEFCDGVWYCKGGLSRIGDALAVASTNAGVSFMYSTEVQAINVDKVKRQVSGVTLKNGQRLEADIVVANADLAYVYSRLLPDEAEARRCDALKYTSSAIMFYWGLDCTFPALGMHNMFLASDFRGSFDEIFARHRLPAEPSFYIHCPARIDPSAAPKGQDSLMVLVPCGCLSDKMDAAAWEEAVARARKAVLARLKSDLGIVDLEQHIKFEERMTPQGWADRFHLHKGSCFGLSHTFTQLGYLRPHNQHAQYRNLFFTGCSTHPGSGLPNVLVSARLTAQRILLHSTGYPTESPVGLNGLGVFVLWLLLPLLALRYSYALTYFQFHCIFTLPPLAIFLYRLRKRTKSSSTAGAERTPRSASITSLLLKLEVLRKRIMASAVVLAALALVYTTPWDNYLVYKGIWTYPSDRVAVSIGYVPLEEYSFFVLQTMITVLWLLLGMERELLEANIRQMVGREMARVPPSLPFGLSERYVRRLGAAAILAGAGAGCAMVLFGRDNTLYLGLITAWALPIIAVQWFFGGHVSWRERRLLGMAIASPTLYMWVADAVAIQLGIWAISPHYLVGVYMGPLPLEEALFFLLTNCMVAQGALLFARVAERLEQDGQEGKRVSLEPLRGAGSGGGSLQQTLLLAAQAIFRAARRL